MKFIKHDMHEYGTNLFICNSEIFFEMCNDFQYNILNLDNINKFRYKNKYYDFYN